MDIEKLLNTTCEFKQDETFLEEAALTIIKAVWGGIEFDGMSPRRRQGIYKEFGNKIRSASYCNTIDEFITKLCESMDVLTIASRYTNEVVTVRNELKERKLQNDFLEYVSSNNIVLVTLFRDIKDHEGEEAQCKLM